MALLASIVALSLLSSAYAAIGPVTDVHVVNAQVMPDGIPRSAVLAGNTPDNATLPGPLISGRKGDKFSLNVINNLTDPTMVRSTSIHWHGIFQRNSSWADGPAFVTQCPIAPNNSFLYEFEAPGQAGTFWYHSHLSTQYCDGLRGPLVIYDDDDPHKDLYDVDDDSTIITLADWYRSTAPALAPGMTRVVPTQDTVLINGKGRSAGGPVAPLSIINVTQGKRYRFRLVSLSCDPNFIFSIDAHNLTIIEVDGISVEPLVVDSIQIFVGQRYSFILNADQDILNYWVRANPNMGTMGFAGGVNSAILRYDRAPNIEPTTPEGAHTNPMLETNLHALIDPGAPGEPTPGAADVALNLNITFDFDTFLFSINGAPFVPPTAPVLLQILSGTRRAQDLLPDGSVYVVPKDSVIEVSIPGGAIGNPHPFHLHGHAFDVIRSSGSPDFNFVNPVRRDVVSTGVTGDNATFRFRTDNPGPWILHCHIDWHLEIGLAIVFAEDADDIGISTHPEEWDKLCPTYDALDPSLQ